MRRSSKAPRCREATESSSIAPLPVLLTLYGDPLASWRRLPLRDAARGSVPTLPCREGGRPRIDAIDSMPMLPCTLVEATL